MTPEQMEAVQERLDKSGIPSTFTGDRIDAFRLGIGVALRAMEEVSKPPQPVTEPPKCGQ